MKSLLLLFCFTSVSLCYAQNEDVVFAVETLNEIAKPEQLDLTIAEQYYKAQDYKSALKVIKEYKKKYPNNEQILLLESQVFMDNKKYKKALSNLDQVLLINPQSHEAYYYRGLVEDLKGDHVDAIVQFTQSITLNPDYALPYEGRATSKSIVGDNFGAIDDYSKAIELSPESIFAYQGRGIAYHKTGQHKKAIEDFNKVIKKDIRSSSNSVIIFYRGLSKVKTNDSSGCRDLSKAYGMGMQGAAVEIQNYCQ